MGYFQVWYDSRIVNYDCRGFIRVPLDSPTIRMAPNCKQKIHTKSLPFPGNGVQSFRVNLLWPRYRAIYLHSFLPWEVVVDLVDKSFYGFVRSIENTFSNVVFCVRQKNQNFMVQLYYLFELDLQNRPFLDNRQASVL